MRISTFQEIWPTSRSWSPLWVASVRQTHSSELPCTSRNSFRMDSVWQKSSQHVTMTSYTVAAPRRQQSRTQPQSLLGNGRSGATLHESEWVLPVDRFCYCVSMDPETFKQMEEIRRQQGCSDTRRHCSSDMEACAISIQSCWPHLKRHWTYNTFNINTMVEGSTMA